MHERRWVCRCLPVMYHHIGSPCVRQPCTDHDLKGVCYFYQAEGLCTIANFGWRLDYNAIFTEYYSALPQRLLNPQPTPFVPAFNRVRRIFIVQFFLAFGQADIGWFRVVHDAYLKETRLLHICWRQLVREPYYLFWILELRGVDGR